MADKKEWGPKMNETYYIRGIIIWKKRLKCKYLGSEEKIDKCLLLIIDAVFKTALTRMHEHYLQYTQDEIASILWWEDEAVGPGPQVVTGGLCLRDKPSQHVGR